MKKEPSKYANFGYSVWDTRRIIREAENVSRWNPWLAHAWMDEAKNSLSLDRPFYSEFDAAVDRINYRWSLLKRFDWFDEGDFWKCDDKPNYTTYLEKI